MREYLYYNPGAVFTQEHISMNFYIVSVANLKNWNLMIIDYKADLKKSHDRLMYVFASFPNIV